MKTHNYLIKMAIFLACGMAGMASAYTCGVNFDIKNKTDKVLILKPMNAQYGSPIRVNPQSHYEYAKGNPEYKSTHALESKFINVYTQALGSSELVWTGQVSFKDSCEISDEAMGCSCSGLEKISTSVVNPSAIGIKAESSYTKHKRYPNLLKITVTSPAGG